MNKTGIASGAFRVRQITTIGVLSAISIALGISGYGFIPLPLARATIMHIPVIIGAIIEGPVVGVMIGIIFGVFSIIQNIAAPTLLSFAFINPLVSVVPRAIIGLTTFYSYKYMGFIKNEYAKTGISAAIGSLTNTFGVLTMIYLLYAQKYAEINNISPKAAAGVIYGIALKNGIPEAIIAVIIALPVVYAVRKLRHTDR